MLYTNTSKAHWCNTVCNECFLASRRERQTGLLFHGKPRRRQPSRSRLRRVLPVGIGRNEENLRVAGIPDTLIFTCRLYDTEM